jgi:AAA+ superfamily predicted ATPase
MHIFLRSSVLRVPIPARPFVKAKFFFHKYKMKKAKEKAPSIIFIDEIDAVAKKDMENLVEMMKEIILSINYWLKWMDSAQKNL